MTNAPSMPDTPIIAESGRFYVEVPWNRADDLHEKLRRCGYPSTLCLDPSARQALLELWPGVDPAAAQAALDGLRPDLGPPALAV